MKVKDLFAEGNPFDFAEPVVKFKKLDDLPKKPNSIADVDKAMKALHKMVHAQAHAYGGKHGKLLPVGITESVKTPTQVAADLLKTAPSELEVVDKITADQIADDGRELATRLIRMANGKSFVRLFSWQHKLFARVESPTKIVMYTQKPVAGMNEDLTPGEQKRRQELYGRWKELINMSADSIENFVKQQTAAGRKDPKKYPGMKPAAASSMGISSGVQSAKWIAKMKRTPVKSWTPEMWRWAGKQVSFVSRMLGNSGPMHDDKGEPTRKLLSLKVWGHNPR